jgi:hypothetical protein
MNNLIVLVLCLSSQIVFAHDHAPYTETHSGQIFNAVILNKISRVQTKIEVMNGTRYKDRNSSKLLVGSYYRFDGKQRLGLFYSQQKGLRHSEDWDLKNSKWFWKDTSQRTEELYDITYTKKIRHIGKPLIYNLNSTYQINKNFGFSTLILKPGIQYFFQRDGLIKYSLKLDLPLYFAMNYDDENLYKKGLYLAAIYHYSKIMSFAITANYLEETWVESSIADKIEPNEPYTVTETIQTVGFNLILNY